MVKWKNIAKLLSAALENATYQTALLKKENERLRRRLEFYRANERRQIATSEIKVYTDWGGRLPQSAHELDAGYDLFTPDRIIVPAKGSCTVDTKVHMEIPEGCAGVIISKSGLNVKHDITSTGLIDAGYTGSIRVHLQNHSETAFEFGPGEKVSQIMIVSIRKPVLHQVADFDALGTSARGEHGFGSTGK